MLIPYQALEPETLTNLVESFILREETNYDEQELSLPQKTELVLQQLKSGKLVILYSQLSESTRLIHKEQFNQQLNNN